MEELQKQTLDFWKILSNFEGILQYFGSFPGYCSNRLMGYGLIVRGGQGMDFHSGILKNFEDSILTLGSSSCSVHEGIFFDLKS